MESLWRQSVSVPGVSNDNAAPDKNLTHHMNVISSVDSRSDGQTEAVNRNLENLLRCLVTDNQASWDLLLPQAEFAYNNFVNRSNIGHSPFEVVTGTKLRLPCDLFPLPNPIHHSEATEYFSRDIQQPHIDVRCKLTLSANSYKAAVEPHRRHVEF
ncbi:uncharacterized protein LOC133863156 [Alnus glutinosa]|uniref:uncharacterized protein LOC133863156 n=1 Tax=Alnus glutinosa TaxID=3517 RepID=UPI002D79B8E0|nr:uncharacterized protein LOC133863156 [Alnus glutinosa]